MYKIKNIILNKTPIILARAVFPNEEKSKIKDKNKKQFINMDDVSLIVFFEKNNQEKKIEIFANKGYLFDGATIPFNIGKGNMKLLVPALFHDIMCERKRIVDFDRLLSSLIFKELLLLCGVSKFKSYFMYIMVDNFQKIFVDWSSDKGI